MNISFRFFRVLSAALAIAAGMAFGQEQKLTLDEAIVESIKYLSGKLDAGTGVVFLRFDSDRKKLSDYIIEESCIRIMNSPKLSLVDAKNLLTSQTFYGASEQQMTEAGKTLGAGSVIYGSIQKIGEDYRFRVQSLDVKTGKTQGAQSFAVIADKTLLGLLGTEQYNLSDGRENRGDYTSNGNGFYGSFRYSLAVPWSFVGGDVEIGGVVRNFFFSGDWKGGGLGISKLYIGGGGSFGARIQPTKSFQIIAGGSGGCWVAAYRHHGVFFGGPFVKFLWGKNHIWYELYSRTLIGVGVCEQVGVGVALAPSRRN